MSTPFFLTVIVDLLIKHWFIVDQ